MDHTTDSTALWGPGLGRSTSAGARRSLPHWQGPTRGPGGMGRDAGDEGRPRMYSRNHGNGFAKGQSTTSSAVGAIVLLPLWYGRGVERWGQPGGRGGGPQGDMFAHLTRTAFA